MILMKCTRPDCPKHIEGWSYNGKKQYPGMTPCPYCRTQVRIPKERGQDSILDFEMLYQEVKRLNGGGKVD